MDAGSPISKDNKRRISDFPSEPVPPVIMICFSLSGIVGIMNLVSFDSGKEPRWCFVRVLN